MTYRQTDGRAGEKQYVSLKGGDIIVFMKHCAPKHLLVRKDGALFYDKGHLMFEASSYTTHYPEKLTKFKASIYNNIQNNRI